MTERAQSPFFSEGGREFSVDIDCSKGVNDGVGRSRADVTGGYIRVCHEPHMDFMYPNSRFFIPNMGPVF